jgi:hypothetical protein
MEMIKMGKKLESYAERQEREKREREAHEEYMKKHKEKSRRDGLRQRGIE